MSEKASPIDERVPIHDLVFLDGTRLCDNYYQAAFQDRIRITPVETANGGNAYEINYHVYINMDNTSVLVEIVRHSGIARVVYKTATHICPSCGTNTQPPLCWHCFAREDKEEPWQEIEGDKNVIPRR